MDKASKGFIKLDRAIFEHWIFQDAEKFKAFVDLIQLMRFRDGELIIGNEVVEVPRGSYYTSILKLANRWGWSRDKTRAFLSLLEKQDMIKINTTTKGTMLTLENYRLYQDEPPTLPTTNPQQTDNEKTSNRHQTDNESYTKEECKEREERKECKEREERYKNTISKDIVSNTKVQPIIDKWNSLGLQKIVSINTGTNRYKLLNARIKEYGEEAILSAINEIQLSTFLKGQNKKSWIITFDWFIKPNNFIKVLEGNYRDKSDNTEKHSSFGESMRKLYKEAIIEDEQEGINADNDYPW